MFNAILTVPVHVHMTHVVKIDIITGHEGKVVCLFFVFFAFHSVDHFSLHIYRKTMQFLKTCTVNYERITYCLTKFCYF